MTPNPKLVLQIIAVLLLASPLRTDAQTQSGPNPYFAPYLHTGELPDGSLMPLFSEVWRIMGYQLMQPNFTAQVDKVSQSIFAVYHYHGQATGVTVSTAAPVYLGGQPGKMTWLYMLCRLHHAVNVISIVQQTLETPSACCANCIML